MSDESKSPINVWWFAAGGLLLLVLVGGVVVGFLAGRSSEEPAPVTAPTSDGEMAPSPPAPGEESGECQVPADDQSYPLEAPETEWELYDNRFVVPTSETYGPTIRDEDGFWRCYAHSPTGAVYAGIGLSVAFSSGVREAGTDTPEAQAEFERQSAANDDYHPPEILGFRVVQYTDDAATLEYLVRAGDIDGALGFRVVWDEEAGDWRLDPTYAPAEEDPDESRFARWR